MTYKCLFSVLTDAALADDTLAHAVAGARRHDAHLDLLCLGVDRSQSGYYYAGANALVLQETIDHAVADAEAVATRARHQLEGADLRWSVETGIAQLADIARHVGQRARFADLAILPQPYGEARGAELEPVTEAVLFEGACPAMVLPAGNAPTPAPKRVMIAWNETAEALSAVKAAMPVLATAEEVHVVIVDPPAHGPSRSDPGGPLSQYLARHDIRAEISVLSRTLPRVSDVLIRHGTDMNADLLVMGAYGHSRVREAIFGGATRNMLEHCPLPVLLAH